MEATRFTDRLAALLARGAAPAFRFLAYNHRTMPHFRAAADRAGFQVRALHYYEPTYPLDHLPDDIGGERALPGLDLREAAQLALLARCRWGEELAGLTRRWDDKGVDGLNYGPGDADMLYTMIRLFRPARMVEIGSGASTLIARQAMAANWRDDPGYACRHLCVEPYEMPWLEGTGAEVRRERVERIDRTVFDALGANDILFIDSSHVIRPFGDVLAEFHEIVPRLAPGVLVHVHDVFTPRDYPARWLREERRLWNEQYLLESFLAFNGEFEVVAALNWLRHHHFDALAAACPPLRDRPDAEPGAFWFRRRPAAAIPADEDLH